MTNIRIDDMDMYFGVVYAGKVTEIIPYYTIHRTDVLYISYIPMHSPQEFIDITKPNYIEFVGKDARLIYNITSYSKRNQNLKVLVIESESEKCPTTWNH